MKKFSTIFAALITSIFTGACSSAKIELPPGTILLDVRSEAEFQDRHLPGSILIPHDKITEKAPQLLTEKTASIAVFCRSGRRSAIAKNTLEKLGYTAVTDLGSIDNAAKILNSTIIEK